MVGTWGGGEVANRMQEVGVPPIPKRIIRKAHEEINIRGRQQSLMEGDTSGGVPARPDEIGQLGIPSKSPRGNIHLQVGNLKRTRNLRLY